MFLSPNFSSLSGLATGRLFIMTAFTKVKIAALAPIPKARVSTAVAVNPGVFRSWRRAKRISCRNIEDIIFPYAKKG
jgi:hypothetical protein